MRKLMMAMLLVGAGLTEATAQSSIKVSLADKSPINVAVDGRYFNKTGTTVTVGDLPPGRHFVQIYGTTYNRRGRPRQDVVYEGKIKTMEGMVALFTYDQNSRQLVTGQVDIATFNNNLPPNSGGRIPDQQYAQENGNNNNNGSQYNNGSNGNDNSAQGASPVGVGSLTDAKVDKLKTTVDPLKTDTEKTNVLKAALENETMTTFQVSTMMDWLEFESSKVAFAEWAYDKATDKDYFTDLESKLTYKNYQDDLDKFIKSKH